MKLPLVALLTHAGHAEVTDRDAEGCIDEEIRRLQVAMDRAGRVDGFDAKARLLEDPHGFAEVRKRAFRPRPEPLIDGPAFDVLHDEVRRAFVLAEGEHGEHVAMTDPRHGPRFVVEERAHLREREELGLDELDRDLAVEPLVDGERDRAHAAHPERALDTVLVVDQRAFAETDHPEGIAAVARTAAGAADGPLEAAALLTLAADGHPLRDRRRERARRDFDRDRRRARGRHARRRLRQQARCARGSLTLLLVTPSVHAILQDRQRTVRSASQHAPYHLGGARAHTTFPRETSASA